MEDIVLRICRYLGYDFNTVELAVRDGIPYAIDFCNPAPDADVNSVGQGKFQLVVETAATFRKLKSTIILPVPITSPGVNTSNAVRLSKTD